MSRKPDVEETQGMKLRSLLFVPGDSGRKLSKSVTVSADALILDLEDSVAPENKAAARKLTGDFLTEQAEGRQKQLWVRINPIDQPAAMEDLAAIMHGRPDGIVQPKTRSPDDVLLLGQHLQIFEKDLGFDDRLDPDSAGVHRNTRSHFFTRRIRTLRSAIGRDLPGGQRI